MSKKITTILLVLLVGMLISGTIFERSYGPAFALRHIYHSPIFITLWGLLVLADIFLLIKGKAFRRPVVSLLHSALFLILAGALLSMLTGIHGQLHLRQGEASNRFQSGKTDQEMPFFIRLQSFEVVNYPGTRSPMDYVSHVTLETNDGQVLGNADISMNNILKHKNYRFYQSHYGEDGSSTLSVSHDPWGIGCTYTGYGMLLISLIGLFLEKKGRFRSLLRASSQVKTLAVCLALGFLAAFTPATSLAANRSSQPQHPRTLPKESARKFGEMYVLYQGRICPMQTLAKDFTVKLCGKTRYKGLTPEQVFSGWLFYFNEWAQEPMIRIKGKQPQTTLGLNGKMAKLTDFSDPMGNHPIEDALESMSLKDPRFAKYSAANEKQQLVVMLYSGALLKIFPHTDSTGQLDWFAQNDALPLDIPEEEYLFIRKQSSYCKELVLKNDFETLELVFEKTRKYQEQQAAGWLPSPARYQAERIYNRISAGKWRAMLSITLGLLCFALYLFQTGKDRKLSPAIRYTALAYLIAQTILMAIFYLLRWIAGGHIPMAGSHDTMTLLSLFIGLLTLCLYRRAAIILPAGLLMSGFTQLVSMIGGANPPVTQLMPVLTSPLLSLHVTVIMIAYALLFFVMLNGISALLQGRKHPETMERLRLLSSGLLYPAVALLAIGIFVGAIWANVSWGNYWSWDPKEVWALITLLVYAAPLHDQLLTRFQKPLFFHLYNILAFLCVLITYFGVNFILGGMHAYN